MRWPIRHQILLPTAMITSSAVMVVSLITAWIAARHAERRVDEQLRQLGRTLLTSSFPLTGTVLTQMHGLSGAHFVLFGQDGRVVAASRESASGLQAAPTPVNDWRQLRLGDLRREGGDNYFVSALAIGGRGSERQPAVLQISYPESHWLASRREAALPPLLGGLAALVISVPLSALIARRISRPVARLRGQVTRLADGDFSTLPLPDRDDELRDLARSVNVLAEQLLEMRQAIRRTERLTLLGRLGGALAHHLRNDLTGTRMAVQLHQRGCTAGDRESLDVALRQLELSEQHLQRLLAAGQPRQPHRADCGLGEIARHVVQLVEPTCRHRSVDLTCLPAPAGRAFRLWADEEQLRQLLMNLVVNAIEAAGVGGWVRIELDHTNGAIGLRVLDSGAGPPAEVAGQLFEEFVTSKAEGVGLGLAVARRIAESHGGTLNYAPRDGHTCFEVRFPLADHALNDDSPSIDVACGSEHRAPLVAEMPWRGC